MLSTFTQSGIYLWDNGNLSKVVDTQTSIPGGTGNFTNFDDGALSLKDSTIAFSSTGSGMGIFSATNGVVSRIAGASTPVPGGSGNFDQLRYPRVDGDNYVFYGARGSVEGIYARMNGQMIKITDSQSVLPGQVTPAGYGELGLSMALDGGDVVFESRTPGSGGFYRGLYTWINGQVQRVVDGTTSIPSGSGTFSSIDRSLSLDDGHVAFAASDSAFKRGIYTNVNGFLQKVVAQGDTLNGKLVVNVNLFNESLSGTRIAFIAGFSDQSNAIFIANVPEPGAIVLLANSALLLLRRKRPANH